MQASVWIALKLKHTKQLHGHASLQDKHFPLDCYTTLTQLLFLFNDKAATPAMIKHGINVLKSDTESGQIPVMTFDAPLFALAKFVQ